MFPVLSQTLVYWPPLGDNAFAKPQYGTPIELDCIWTDVVTDTISPQGDMVQSGTSVTLDGDDVWELVPGQVILPQGIMWEGCLTNALLLPAPIRSNPGVHEIINVSKTPLIGGLQNILRVQLK